MEDMTHELVGEWSLYSDEIVMKQFMEKSVISCHFYSELLSFSLVLDSKSERLGQ